MDKGNCMVGVCMIRYDVLLRWIGKACQCIKVEDQGMDDTHLKISHCLNSNPGGNECTKRLAFLDDVSPTAYSSQTFVPIRVVIVITKFSTANL